MLNDEELNYLYEKQQLFKSYDREPENAWADTLSDLLQYYITYDSCT